jgi:hypothetical protein
MSTPGDSSASSLSSSPIEARDAGLLDGSLTSLSGNASTADTDDLNHIDDTTSRQKHSTYSSPTIRSHLREAFAQNILAKTCKVAAEALLRRAADPAGGFPEYCPQTGDDYGQYTLREPEFWTCGFFPGTLYALLERAIRFPHALGFTTSSSSSTSHTHPQSQRPTPSQILTHLSELCSAWSTPLHSMSLRTDTHDLGFIIMPALRQDWELTHNPRSLASIVRAAHSLASRYVPAARAIRSWDLVRRRDMEIVGLEENLLVIIDSMCNLDLLYYAAAHSGEGGLAEVATAHARTVLGTHLRPENMESPPPVEKGRYTGQLFSTCHVANLDPRTGKLRRRATAQGYADDSTWARGQAWAVLGFAQTYMWTGEREFLDAACGCAEYFLYRLETAPACVDVVVGGADDDGEGPRTVGRYVPLWDFDAPIEDESNPTRDSSAGVIAANGMLVLSQALAGAGQADLATRFRDAAVAIVRDTVDFALAREKVRFRCGDDGGLVAEDVVEGSRFDALLAFGTANNNTYARKRYANHGLVYGDYYLVEFGNQLLRMGLA